MTTVSGVDAGVVDDNLWSIVEQVWESLLQAPARLGDPASGVVGPAAVHASVALVGDWTGAVDVSCARPTAEDISRAMLGLAPHEPVGDEDVRDALGEVANVVGGNVKSLLGGVTSLGLPEVGSAPAHAGEPVSRADVDWDGAAVRVEVRLDRFPTADHLSTQENQP